MKNQRVKRTTYKIRHTHLIGPLHMYAGILRRDHDHRNILNPAMLIHQCEDSEAVHLRHYNVQQQQRDGIPVLLKKGNRLHAILCLHNIILIPQHIRQNRPVHLRIVCNQNGLSGTFFSVNKTHSPFPETCYMSAVKPLPETRGFVAEK